MNSKPWEIGNLLWILFVAAILGHGFCDSAMQQRIDGKRKYLEVDDLRGFDRQARFTSEDEKEEETADVLADSSKAELPRKIERRSARVDSNLNGLQHSQERPREPRQKMKKPKPGFFWTLARVTFETFNDTRSAIQQINQIINESIPNESTPAKQGLASLKMKTMVAPGNRTESDTETMTEEPEFKLTRPLLLSLVRRNVNGLVRLFNIEWRDAINQSQKNVQEFQRDLGKQVGMYLQDNPNNY
ncbi:PREDICTED: uncharacterized protein LOC105359178 [Ceratosolen solmsi marchali]|uniref:Uncharacterized protein LOC105359178 n=1 Tax=Ceratosolen solmsi marchali TaxID=326594 RepID=A0AAJ6YBK0_9HYME|nr:PREDICTED: uncharacterized protein LOC105359178 [Ceratosolen solmsi marchali]XP_011493990.1 PREDICTED: uncharacterized protein LOC105359178 [Ceratosolen solmsi marchali]XP_011493991.1 PREDICTED: uncharacterized protein LOC105359178 [Ceratosolen solmsi marchali]